MNNILEKIHIIFENNDFLAINKPAGLLVHPIKKNSKEKTLVDWIIAKYPSIKKVGENSIRPGIVHRLDRDTSGIMLVMKNNKAFSYFKSLFQKREIKKMYLALVFGKTKKQLRKLKNPSKSKSTSPETAKSNHQNSMHST